MTYADDFFFFYSFGEQDGALLLLMSESWNGIQTVEL